MENTTKTKGINLESITTEKLERMLKSELYINIDSEFAVEIQSELERRKGVE